MLIKLIRAIAFWVGCAAVGLLLALLYVGLTSSPPVIVPPSEMTADPEPLSLAPSEIRVTRGQVYEI